jgi:asparagine synthase (glutamine-hydrolysing)
VPVTLDGQGGDELFLGYQWYNSAVLRDMLAKGRLLAALRHYLLTSRRSSAGYIRQFIELLYLQTSVLRGLHLGHRGRQWLKRPFLRSQSMLGRLANLRMPVDLLKMQIHQIYSAPLPGLLRYEDRSSMAFAVESRLPMLDYRLVELAISLPWQYKNREGWTKYVLRQAVSELLPQPVVWRRNKFGFFAPQQEWMAMMNGQIGDLLRQDLACSAIVDVGRVRRDFAAGKIGQKVLWRFFNLEHWMRMFSVQI